MIRRFVTPDSVAALFCFGLLLLVLLCAGGCSLFRGSRVEARADYSIFAEDLNVSVVAVGYVRE